MRNLPTTVEDPLKILKKTLDMWTNKDGRQTLEFWTGNFNGNITVHQEAGRIQGTWNQRHWLQTDKYCCNELNGPINFFVNLSLTERWVPAKWKIAKIMPLHKRKLLDKHLPSSYRPISILPALSKIAERAVQSQIDNFMKRTNQWNENQHVYRAGLSTTTSLLQLSDILYQASEKKQITVAMSIDETAAFDCVCREILLEKLKLYKFGSSLTDWILSYMSHRSQFVSIGTKQSDITYTTGHPTRVSFGTHIVSFI